MSLRLFVVFALLALPAPSYAVPSSPQEEDSLRVSRRLKGISDDEWKQIAGERANAEYDIIPGDTLSAISGRLFGDGKYWPKIWALNNASITNPHLIRPGNKVTFLPGTGSSLPAVSMGGADEQVVMTDTSGPNSGLLPANTA